MSHLFHSFEENIEDFDHCLACTLDPIIQVLSQ